MAATLDKQKLEDALNTAGSQWRDEDLDDIMALLEKDYTHPQPTRPVLDSAAVPKDELADLHKILGIDDPVSSGDQSAYTRPERPFPDLSGFIPEDERKAPPELPKRLHLEENSEAEQLPDILPKEEFIPTEPHRVGTGEQPDFDETPVKGTKDRALLPLGLLAAAEIIAVILILLWWRQWIL